MFSFVFWRFPLNVLQCSDRNFQVNLLPQLLGLPSGTDSIPEDDLIFIINRSQPQFLGKWKMNSIFRQMEDNLNIIVIGRQPKFLAHGRRSQLFVNGRRLQICNTGNEKSKIKIRKTSHS